MDRELCGFGLRWNFEDVALRPNRGKPRTDARTHRASARQRYYCLKKGFAVLLLSVAPRWGCLVVARSVETVWIHTYYLLPPQAPGKGKLIMAWRSIGWSFPLHSARPQHLRTHPAILYGGPLNYLQLVCNMPYDKIILYSHQGKYPLL